MLVHSYSQSKTKNTEKLHFVYGILELALVFASEISQSLNQTKLCLIKYVILFYPNFILVLQFFISLALIQFFVLTQYLDFVWIDVIRPLQMWKTK